MPPATLDWPSPAGRASERRGKVLLVEEDRQDLDYYAGILRARGYQVVACVSHGEGLRCLEQDVFEFVIVTQGTSAFEGQCVVERAVDIDRHMPVLVTTRRQDLKCYLEAMQLGAVDYLEDPVPPERLVWVIETHLRPRSSAARDPAGL